MVKSAPTPPPVPPVDPEAARLRRLLMRWVEWIQTPGALELWQLHVDTRRELGMPAPPGKRK